MKETKKVMVALFAILGMMLFAPFVFVSAEETPQVEAALLPPSVPAPSCSIEQLVNQVNHAISFNFSDSIYVPSEGNFLVMGSAYAYSTVGNVAYNRTSPNVIIQSWADANAAGDGYFNEQNEIWSSNQNDARFVNGWNEVCCRTTSEFGFSDDTCLSFCIDTENPSAVAEIELSNPSECNPIYVNETPAFEWDAAESNGCAPISHYVVDVYEIGEDEDLLLYTEEIARENVTLDADEISSGNGYYVKVTAVDEAGNVGPAEESDTIYYDTEAPTVTIDTSNDGWMTETFTVSETDSDDMDMLHSCEYRIHDSEDNADSGWIALDECGDDVEVLIDDGESYCPNDGEGACVVEKRVLDGACNVATAMKAYNVDTVAPETTKEVLTPKVDGEGRTIFEIVVDWFITPDTLINLSCSDDTSGCNRTYCKVWATDDEEPEEWTLFEEAFSVDAEDGVYNISYYSVDNAGNEEVSQSETDKIDSIGAMTELSVSPKWVNSGKTWVNASSLFNISGTDEEVGVGKIYYDVWGVVTGDEEDTSDLLYDESVSGQSAVFMLSDYCGEGYDYFTVNYYGEDLLGNQEDETHSEKFYLDCDAPEMTIFNPTLAEAEDVEKCVQSIVTRLQESESGLGGTWATLEDSQGNIVKAAALSLKSDKTYAALMDKQLPAGVYTLKVYAVDNMGNMRVEQMTEVLNDGVFVESISPGVCSISAANGGSCDFTYRACVRGADSIKFWMDKLGDVASPGLMNARIVKNDQTSYVGLRNATALLTPADEIDALMLGDGNINGRTDFHLLLDVPAEVSSGIGNKQHDVDYKIIAYTHDEE